MHPVTSPSGLAVQADDLVKNFGQTRALDGLRLAVPAGSVYGLLGPNGAGKTTSIRILATLLRPDRGSARVLGHDVVREPDAVRRRICLTGQFAALDDDLTGVENLTLLGRLLGLRRARAKERARELLAAFGLADAGGRPLKSYSGGMRRRVDLAASIIVTPDLLFLDEPTTGLDPQARKQIWDVVRSVAAAGTTVLLTTQYLDEADELADRIAVIDNGRVIAEGSPSSLKASVGAGSLELRLADPELRPRAAALVGAVLSVPVRLSNDAAVLSAHIKRLDGVPELLAELRSARIELASFAVGQPSLDEVFLALVGRPVAEITAEEEAA